MTYQNSTIPLMYLTPVSLSPFKSLSTLSDWTKESPLMSNLTSRMKEYLTKGFSLGMGFTVFDSFEEEAGNGGFVPYPKPTESVQGGHAVTIVGYDEKKGDGGAFLFKNSWGTDWGERGDGCIRMKDFEKQENADAPLADDIWTIIKQEWLD